MHAVPNASDDAAVSAPMSAQEMPMPGSTLSMALLTAALSGENEPIFMLVYTVVAAVADTLWIERKDRVRKDRALRILLEEGVRAGLVGVAAARSVGRHLVRVAEVPWRSGIVICLTIAVSTGRTREHRPLYR